MFERDTDYRSLKEALAGAHGTLRSAAPRLKSTGVICRWENV